MNCKYCKNIIDDDSEFCPQCGLPLLNRCSNNKCNKQLNENDRYCKYCGASSRFLNSGLFIVKNTNEDECEDDDLLPEAIELAVNMGQASAAMIQRKFKIGYARAGRIIDQLEERGIVSGYDGSKPRQTLISKSDLTKILNKFNTKT